jgi:UDP-N-acetyl-D-galactosamine dehydrogenase
MRNQRPKKLELSTCRIAIIGLGYVGLPLAVEFGRTRSTIGFDINPKRVAELKRFRDSTREAEPRELRAAKKLRCTDDMRALKKCNVFIVTVPTPIDRHNQPDLVPIERATRMLGGVLKPGDVVIYESTVYPGCTEEIAVPILEAESGLKYNRDFFCGYSPERINPGDKEHRLPTIKKVTSGSTPAVADFVDALYGTIITAGTFKASSIRVAEASKVIENTQRDANIAIVNELARIFSRLGMDTEEVLKAAGTKWNFLPFRPGLVGGHCIGVDPYYLTHKAQEVGYNPEVILAARRLNDGMAVYIAERVMQLMAKKRVHISGARVLVMGITFKEDCPDVRNSKAIDLVRELEKHGATVDAYDPWADPKVVTHEYGLTPIKKPSLGRYDAIVLAVAHREFKDMGIRAVRRLAKPKHVVFDVKYVFKVNQADGRL